MQPAILETQPARKVRRRTKSAVRRGLTLVEVMLVLALLVIIATFSWPAVNKAFSNQRLMKAADIVRTHWCKSRVKAMSAGRIVLFRYEVNGSRFYIEQLDDVTSFENMASEGTAADVSETADAAYRKEAATAAPQSASQNTDYAGAEPRPSLPEGIVFRSGEVENDSRAMTLKTDPLDASTNVIWSAPIYFYPDGTSSSARLQICNDRSRAVELALRGLTGVAKVGEITAVEGVTP
jgi:prepilin-type N-terminal cleavage/methylation domain-containing protein